MVGPAPTSPQTYLQIIGACDNFRVSGTSTNASNEHLTPWHLTPEPFSPAIGLLRPVVLSQLRAENARGQPVWEFSTHGGQATVSFATWIRTSAQRTRVMKEMCERWRDEDLWTDIIGPKKWRGELYPVYRNPFGAHDSPAKDEDALDTSGAMTGDTAKNYAFMMERAACALFGVVTYGVHMTIYEDDVDADGARSCKIWVPTRSRTKQTWPGYLDNSVAGGIPCGLGAFESLVKESMEEASIEENVVRKYVRSVGSVSYFFRTDAGWLQPEVEYVYDLRVPPGVDPAPFQPKPLDGEVELFELLPLDEVITRMRSGLFKRNCALVLVEFMIRHGYLTLEAEPEFLEIITRLHGRFDYDKW
ncbi:NUDIX hydrolase domain-like protein [Sparassis latifolia]|uniref:Nudix hydrolase domain-containing protein n=1 Tax=Sparassis crispa TaxID=139825 RepID=A0A401GNQ9_9APHY|nr:Uncharacterized protein SCP_0504320 [Sparassis crispa]GBE83384.1 Uncharacterized protein SCP_0504320 [Sparassis crispa]